MLLQIELSLSKDTLETIDRLAKATLEPLDRLASCMGQALLALTHLVPVTASEQDLAILRAAMTGFSGHLTPGEPLSTGQRGGTAAGLATPKDDPPALTPRPPKSRWRTPERKAVLPDLYASKATLAEIVAALNALPGPSVPHKQAVRIWALQLGAHRPAENIPPELVPYLSQRSTVRGAAASADPSPRLTDPPPKASPPLRRAESIATPEPPAAAASPPHAAGPSSPKTPRTADRETIISFCDARGWAVYPFDIAAINKHCARVGLPGFILRDPPARGAKAA